MEPPPMNIPSMARAKAKANRTKTTTTQDKNDEKVRNAAPHLREAREAYKQRKGNENRKSSSNSNDASSSSAMEEDDPQQQQQRQAHVLALSSDAKQRRQQRKETGGRNNNEEPLDAPLFPGAFRMYEEDVDEDELMEQGKNKSNSHDDLIEEDTKKASAYNSASNLIEATLVEEETTNKNQQLSQKEEALLAVAEPLVETPRGFFQTPKGKCCACVLVIIGIVCIIGITVGITNNNKNALSSPPTTEPPTPQPTAFEFLDHLPEPTKETVFLKETPQSKAYEWLQNDPFFLMASDDNNEDSSSQQHRMYQRFALATLYYATGGPNWLQSENWLSHDEDECYWYSGSDENDVNCELFLTLSLPSNGLNGTIPEELGLLTSLAIVTLSDNALVGTLPTQLGQLSRLRKLEIDQNQLTGSLPAEIGFLTNLRSVSLFFNFLESLPSELGNLRQLTSLRLDDNRFQGTLISELGQLKELDSLRLSFNSFTGRLPLEWSHMTKLQVANLANNALTGPIPSSLDDDASHSSLFRNWTALRLFNGQNNALTGPLPTEIGMLQSLQTLLLSHNSFSNTLPSELGYLTTIGNLDLSNNQFSGTLPSTLTALTKLSSLNVLDNEHLSYYSEEDTMNTIFQLCQRIDRFFFALDCSMIATPEPTAAAMFAFDDGYYETEAMIEMTTFLPYGTEAMEEGTILPIDIMAPPPPLDNIMAPTSPPPPTTNIMAPAAPPPTAYPRDDEFDFFTTQVPTANAYFLLSVPIEFTIFYRYPQIQRRKPTPEELDGLLYQTDLFFSDVLQKVSDTNTRQVLDGDDFLALTINGYNENQEASASVGLEVPFAAQVSFLILDESEDNQWNLLDSLTSEIQNLMLTSDFDSYQNHYVTYSEPFGTSLFFDVTRVNFQL